jgi:hypothetical protein
MIHLLKIIGIGFATIGLATAKIIGIGVVFGALIIGVWRNTILREKLLLHLTKCNIKIESIISLIRREPKDPWYIKLFKFILGVIIIKTISQFILLPLVNWCWDIIITNLGHLFTPSIQEIIGWIRKIDFSILSQIDCSTLITLIWCLIDIIKEIIDNNFFKLTSTGERGNSQVFTNNSPTQEGLPHHLLSQANSNSAVVSSSNQAITPRDLQEDNLGQLSTEGLGTYIRRLNDETKDLIRRGEVYCSRDYSEYYMDPVYKRTILDMIEHNTKSRKALNYLIDNGSEGNCLVLKYKYNWQSFNKFQVVFDKLLQRYD